MQTRAHVIFYGKVQGVWFRANTERKAVEKGLLGLVRNLRDGSVEAIFEGEKDIIEDVIDWCRHHQPHAKVDRVELSWKDATGEYNRFTVRR